MVLDETARVREIRKTEQAVLGSLDNVNGLITLLKELRGTVYTSCYDCSVDSSFSFKQH
jgi:hypothetical protein